MAASLCYIGFSCIVFLALQQTATGLQCYVCSSCTTASGLTTVASGASGYSCTKSTTMAAGIVAYVSRGSSLTSSCTESNSVVLGSGSIYNCCTTDGCNAGASLSSSIMLAFAFVAAISVFKMSMTN